MFFYTPRLHHVVITLLICIALIALSSRAQGRALTALLIGALGFLFVTGVILWMMIVGTLDHHLETQTEFAKVFNTLDEEARRALSFQFPSMRYHMKRGIVKPYFEDTNVPIETFRLFLQTSNDKYISPRRDWYTADKPEWAWEEIKDWLENNNCIVADSAAGSHSWLWMGTKYQQMFAYWMAGRKIPDLNETRAYAYEEDQQQLA